MKITARSIVLFAIGVVFFTALGGGKYFLSNRLQELGILFSLFLFFYSSILAALNVREKDLNWSFWFFAPFFFISYTMIIPAYVFSTNNGVAMLPSVAACREYLIVFIGPALYFLYRLGLTVEEIQRTIVVTLVALVFSYLFFYFTKNLEADYFSADHTVSSMVTYDPWRGYRLRPPTVAMFLITLITPIKIFYAKTIRLKLWWIVVLAALIVIWAVNVQRAAMGSLIVSVILYHCMFAQKYRLGLFFVALPLIVAGAVVGLNLFFAHLATLDPEFDGVRYKSYGIAWEVIKQNPILGFGQQSYSTKTEQQILWWKFHSSDLGIIGVTFKYGIIGAVLYTLMSYMVLTKTLKTIWQIKKRTGESNALLIAIFCFFVSTTLVIILQSKYIFMPGLSICCLSLALATIYRHSFRQSAISAAQSRPTTNSIA